MKIAIRTLSAMFALLFLVGACCVPAAWGQAPAQHLVLLRSGVPSGFADEVAALGGKLVFSHKLGIAVVSGLSNQAAVQLTRNRNVAEVQPDSTFQAGPAAELRSFPRLTVRLENAFPTRNHVTDLYFHGTHVASTAVSNSYILAGVTTRTTLMGVKICDYTGACSFGSLIAGVLYAADNGADVANLSLGGGFDKAGNGRYAGFIDKVFNYANSRGMTVVVSAGNEAMNLDHDGDQYKTYCSTPNTICVSAIGPTAGGINGPWTNVDAIASYSNYGRSAINVAAPGGTDAGFVRGACSTTSLAIPICRTGIYIVGAAGTSMAAPHVSGLAALLVENVGRNPGKIKAIIQQSADDLGPPGVDPFYGKGRINAGKAVQR